MVIALCPGRSLSPGTAAEPSVQPLARDPFELALVPEALQHRHPSSMRPSSPVSSPSSAWTRAAYGTAPIDSNPASATRNSAGSWVESPSARRAWAATEPDPSRICVLEKPPEQRRVDPVPPIGADGDRSVKMVHPPKVAREVGDDLALDAGQVQPSEGVEACDAVLRPELVDDRLGARPETVDQALVLSRPRDLECGQESLDRIARGGAPEVVPDEVDTRSHGDRFVPASEDVEVGYEPCAGRKDEHRGASGNELRRGSPTPGQPHPGCRRAPSGARRPSLGHPSAHPGRGYRRVPVGVRRRRGRRGSHPWRELRTTRASRAALSRFASAAPRARLSASSPLLSSSRCSSGSITPSSSDGDPGLEGLPDEEPGLDPIIDDEWEEPAAGRPELIHEVGRPGAPHRPMPSSEDHQLVREDPELIVRRQALLSGELERHRVRVDRRVA